MVIKTAVKPRGPSLPSKRPFGVIYESVKWGLKTMGWYEDIKQYDPGYYFERYKYKTGKRVRSKVAQVLQKTYASHNKYRKTRRTLRVRGNQYECGKSYSQSCYGSK